MISWFFIGLVVTILLTPGPTNTLLASSGIVYNSAYSNFNKAVDLYSSINKSQEINTSKQLIQTYGDLAQENLKIYQRFLSLGTISLFLSVISWFIGNRILVKL